MKQGDNGGYLVTQVYMLNGGNPISSLDNGAKYSCAVSNPAISGNTVTKDFFLNVRCKSIYNFKWKGLSSAQCVRLVSARPGSAQHGPARGVLAQLI